MNRVLPGKAALGPKRQCHRRTVVHLGPVAVESLERALNATSPADVGTPITRGAPTRMPGASELASGELAQHHFAGFRPSIVIGRADRPEKVAVAAVFLACDAAAFITGRSLRVDGGLLAALNPWLIPASAERDS